MSYSAQARILFLAAIAFAVCAAYNTSEVISWNLRAIETTGVVMTIDGYSAQSRPRSRGACLQTLHYLFNAPNGKTYHAKDKIWWGDCRLSVGSRVAVYFDQRDPSQSITGVGYKSQRGWAGLFAFFTLMSLITAGFTQMGAGRPSLWKDA